MAMNEQRKMESRQQGLNQKLDKVLAHRASVRRAMKEPSSPMHTPKRALRELEKRRFKRY